jgi:hypothetical protein
MQDNEPYCVVAKCSTFEIPTLVNDHYLHQLCEPAMPPANGFEIVGLSFSGLSFFWASYKN